VVAPRRPIKSFGFGKIWISETPDWDTDCSWRRFHSSKHRRTACRTKLGPNPAPRIDIPPPDPSLASNRHCRFLIDSVVGEGAAAFSLAVEAATSNDLGWLPNRGDRQVATAATGGALAHALCICHFSLPTSENISKGITLACRTRQGPLPKHCMGYCLSLAPSPLEASSYPAERRVIWGSRRCRGVRSASYSRRSRRRRQ
jgi:hypothetical protein